MATLRRTCRMNTKAHNKREYRELLYNLRAGVPRRRRRRGTSMRRLYSVLANLSMTDEYTSFIFLCIDSAYIRRKVFSVGEITFNYSHSADNLSILHSCIPLRKWIFSCQTFLHTVEICFKRNIPFFMESFC